MDVLGDTFNPTNVINTIAAEFSGFLEKAGDEFTREVTGKDLKPVYNCQNMPLGENTEYTLLKFPDILSWIGIDDDFLGGIYNPESGLDLSGVVDIGSYFPDGSDPADECVPFAPEASKARATALNITADEARRCSTDGTGDPCCGASSCLPAIRNAVPVTDENGVQVSECVGTCLKPDDECYTDEQCACIGSDYECQVESDETETDPYSITGKCKRKTAQSTGLVPICVAWNDGMFAIRFFPALFPFWTQLPQKIPGLGSSYKSTSLAKPCSMIDGIRLVEFPSKNLQVTFQFVGVGVAWNSGTKDKPNMIYGTSPLTSGDSVNAPTIYDGLAQVPITVPQINFWLSVNIRFIDLSSHLYNLATCQAGTDKIPLPQPGVVAKFAIEMMVELYVNASEDETCVLLVAPLVVLKFSIIPVVNLGSAIGGYCRLPQDRCTPDGFFLNLKAQPNIANMNGIAEDVLSFGNSETDFGSAGASMGFYLDKATGTPSGGLIKVFKEAPKFMGLTLGPGFEVEFQYISNEEIERRRWTITADIPDGSTQPMPRCPRYERCETWKSYKLVDASGNERLDDDGNILYPGQYICASVLEDNDAIEGVGLFNRQLLAKVPKNDPAARDFSPSPGEWHVQDFFRGYDMFVVAFRLEGAFSIGPAKLEDFKFIIVIFGDIQPAIDPNQEFPDEASRAIACEAAAKNDDLFVYIELEAKLSILMLVQFRGKLTIANVPVAQESGDLSAENANKWTLDALAKLTILGMETKVTALGEWYYTDKDARRRLQDVADPCVTENRRRLESERWQRALSESTELKDVDLDTSVEVNCDSFADCMEDVGRFIGQKLTELYNEVAEVVGKVLEVAEVVFTELGSLLADGLAYLGLGFIADAFGDFFEDVEETFDNAVTRFDEIGSDGFQFEDLAAVGLALLESTGELVLAGGKLVLGLIGIGIGSVRGNRVLERGPGPFGCEKLQNQVYKCTFWCVLALQSRSTVI